MKIRISKIDENARLDIFLAQKLNCTRSQIQKKIKNREIKIDGKFPKKFGEKICENSEIEISEKSNVIPESIRNLDHLKFKN